MKIEEIMMIACETADRVVQRLHDDCVIYAYADNTDDPSGYSEAGRETFEAVYNEVMHSLGADE